MRIDFREERRWKYAIAYNLAQSVLEWHKAGSPEERVKGGICVMWRRPLEGQGPEIEHPDPDPGLMDVDDPPHSGDANRSSMLMLDYASDEDDNDEQDKESIVDALETSTLIKDALQAIEDNVEENPGRIELEPKKEEIDLTATLANGEDRSADRQATQDSEELVQKTEESDALTLGLKANSSDPLLTSSKSTSQSVSGEQEAALPASKSSRINLYAPIRERVAYSDADKLFLDFDDFKISDGDPSSEEVTDIVLPPADLSDIFPDLQPLTLIDPPPDSSAPLPPTEGKKKDKKAEDIHRRVDEFNYSKVFPIGTFMSTKPTLVSALQPAKRWRDGQWLPFEESPIVESDAPSSKVLDESASGRLCAVNCDVRRTNKHVDLFGRVGVRGRSDVDPALPLGYRKPDVMWLPKEDDLLKSLVDTYGSHDKDRNCNWRLIAECFNASRITVPSDRRGPKECYTRWRERWALTDVGHRDQDSLLSSPGMPTPAPAAQMTTRGVKRLASTSISSTTAPNLPGMDVEPKNKRHKTVQDSMRKLIKRRAEVAAKNSRSFYDYLSFILY